MGFRQDTTLFTWWEFSLKEAHTGITVLESQVTPPLAFRYTDVRLLFQARGSPRVETLTLHTRHVSSIGLLKDFQSSVSLFSPFAVNKAGFWFT